ncbi:MAG: hypothetical protein K0R41_4137 [Geminicoccaceae bacterium]|jgi:hypothetical protein|nr:hypothetical protein [Geminicoccaceae bacterium]
MPKKLLEDRELRRRLGGISKSGLFRLRRLDPRCPRPTKVMGKNTTDEDEADVYIEQLLDDRHREHLEAAPRRPDPEGEARRPP